MVISVLVTGRATRKRDGIHMPMVRMPKLSRSMIQPFMLAIVMLSFFAGPRRVPMGALHEATYPSMMLSFFVHSWSPLNLGRNR